MGDYDLVEFTTDLIFTFLPVTALPLDQRNTEKIQPLMLYMSDHD